MDTHYLDRWFNSIQNGIDLFGTFPTIILNYFRIIQIPKLFFDKFGSDRDLPPPYHRSFEKREFSSFLEFSGSQNLRPLGPIFSGVFSGVFWSFLNEIRSFFKSPSRNVRLRITLFWSMTRGRSSTFPLYNGLFL